MSSLYIDYRRTRFSSRPRLNSRVDPTRTRSVRSAFEAEIRRRFAALKRDVRLLLEENSGLTSNARFDFPTKDRKVAEFKKWLREQQDKGILEVIPGAPLASAANQSWMSTYVRTAYQKGLASASQQMRKGGVIVEDRWVDAGFFRPIHADAIGLIYTRAFSDLEGITRALDTRLSNILALGLADGRGMKAVADSIADAIDSIGIYRARVLARTEIIRAHADATLNTYTEAGISGVTVLSEFSTAGDNRVCPKCESLEGRTYTIEEARGVIPVHPNCRCAWLPVVKDSTGIELR